MEDQKYDRRCDTGSAVFPLRTSTNQPSRSTYASAAVPVLMKSSSSKSLLDEVSEKRRRECMSQQLRGVPSLPSKSLFSGGALGGSKAATASDLPTITGKKPLPKALLPKEARKSSYQSVISGPFAFTSGLATGWGAGGGGGGYPLMQRRSSISSCYPLRPSAVRSADRLISNGTDVENRSPTQNGLQTAAAATDDAALWRTSEERARRNSINTLSPPPTEVVTSQISLSRGWSTGGASGVGGGGLTADRQAIDTGSIYPLLRKAFGKDKIEDDSTAVIRRNPDRPSAGRKERPVSYADPHSFRKMQEDLQTPEYVEYPPSYDPPPEPIRTSVDAVVRSESASSSIYNLQIKAPQGHDFENTSTCNPIKLQTSTINSSNSISDDQTRSVSCPSEEEVKPLLKDSTPMKPEKRSPDTTVPKLQSSVSTRLDGFSPTAIETKLRGPMSVEVETISSDATESKIQSPSNAEPVTNSAGRAGSHREEWYSPIPASPRRVIRSPRLSNGSQEKEEISPPACSGSSTKSRESPFESLRRPRPAFSFDIEAKDSTKHDKYVSHTNSSEVGPRLIAEENNNDTLPELPSISPPPLPLTSHLSCAPIGPPSGLRHSDLVNNNTPDSIPDNSSNRPTRRRTAIEVLPALPSSAPPSLPVTQPPANAATSFPPGLRHKDLENDSSSDKGPDNWTSNKNTNDYADNETVKISAPTSSFNPSPSLNAYPHPTDAPTIHLSEGLHCTDPEHSSSSSSSNNRIPDTIPEGFSNEPTNYDDYTTVETGPPPLPSSNPPPLPATAPPTGALVIASSGVSLHDEDLEHGSGSSETDGNFNEPSVADKHGETTAERIKEDGMEEMESMVDRPQRGRSLSSEECLFDGNETRSRSAPLNREPLSPTLSDADSGIDSVQLEQKRSYETNMANEEYQTSAWDEHNETTANCSRPGTAVSPASNDRSIIDSTSTPDATVSSISRSSVEAQQVASNIAMLSPDVPSKRTDSGSKWKEEFLSTKASASSDKETDAAVHQTHQPGGNGSAFSEDDKETSSGDQLPLDRVPPSPLPSPSTLSSPSPLGDHVDRPPSEKSDANYTTVRIQKGIMGLGFSVQGGKGSAYGDKPLIVKKIFKAGDASVKEMLTAGDELISANGKDLTTCSSHEAWNYLKALPDGTIDLAIRKTSGV